jgi:hypothetical protein
MGKATTNFMVLMIIALLGFGFNQSSGAQGLGSFRVTDLELPGEGFTNSAAINNRGQIGA